MSDVGVVPDLGLAERFTRSAATVRTPAAEAADWLAGRRGAHHSRVERIDWDDLDGWGFDPETGDLRHRSGRFFTVEGLRVAIGGDAGRRWHQPVINQPESGIVGILAREIDGVLHFLMQAKMEPGYCNLLQLAPTVQATRSNYDRAHQGAAVKYLEYFLAPEPGDVLVDVLQSAPAAWFLRKTNRAMIVEARGQVPAGEDFRWMTLGEIGGLLRHADHLVNMDTRTALGCAPFAPASPASLHTDAGLLSWFTEIRSRRTLRVERVPLRGLPGWVRTPSTIERADGRFFRVVAVAAEAGNREVAVWTQPIVEPVGEGVNAFLACRIAGALHVLAHARVEPGAADEVELAPTVQTVPGDRGPDDRAPFLDRVLTADPGRIRFDAMLSEEGGRFLNARNRYAVVETEAFAEPPGYRWATPRQLADLARHAHYVNSQARSLLTCMAATGLR